MRHHLLAAASLFAFVSTPAVAQDGGAAQPAPEDTAEIIVTAQLREQRLLDVPLAVTALENALIERLGVNDFEEIARFVPGFDVQNQSPNNPGFVIRGITSDSGQAFVDPRVSVYQDGVSISKSRGSSVELFDLERVEVARGPQSTLYGRGALIGAVNLIQNKARPGQFEALLRGGVGNFDAYSAEAMVNVPLGDTAAVRVAGRYRYRDGYIENLAGGEDFNSVDTAAIRGSLRWQPNDALTIDVIGNYQEDSPAGTAFRSTTYTQTDPVTGTVLAGRNFDGPAFLAPGTGFEGGLPLGLDRQVWGVTGIVRAELSDAVSLTSLTAYREFDSLEIFDADGISLPVLTAAENAFGEQFSQELRLNFDGGGPISAFVGASFFSEEGFQRTPAQFDERILLARLTNTLSGPVPTRPATDPAPLAVFGSTAFLGQLLQGVAAARGVAVPAAQAQLIAANLKASHVETATNAAETQSFDVFGDVTWRVSPTFEIGAGLRYTRDDKTTSYTASVLNGRSILGGFVGALGLPAAQRGFVLAALAQPGAATAPSFGGVPVPLFGLGSQPTAGNGSIDTAQLEDEGFAWRVFARLEAAPNTSIYANYARGRRPELLSASSPSAPFGPSRFTLVDAETVDSFELGVRTEQLGRRLFLDASVFYYNYQNFQTVEQIGTEFVTTNAGEARSYGLEFAGRYRAVENLELFGTYAYNNSRFEAGVRNGNRFRLSPDHTLSAGLTLTVPVTGRSSFDFTPTVTYQSEVFFDDDNDIAALQRGLVADLLQDEFQDGYALVNLRLGYNLDRRFRVEAFVNNALDQSYLRDAGNTGDSIGLPTFIAGEPRTYGVQATLRF